MGQQEVLDFLVDQRLRGNNRYLSTREIHDGLRNSGVDEGVWYASVSYSLRQLARYGVVDTRRKSHCDWLVMFRVSDEEYNRRLNILGKTQHKTYPIKDNIIPITKKHKRGAAHHG